MDNIYTKGFLSTEIEDVTQHVHKKYGDCIKLFKDISDYAVLAQYKIEIIHDNFQSLIAGMLFIRTLANCQGAYLLIERGMDIQARILLRATLESLFSFVAICKSEQTAQEFIDANECARKKMLNKARMWEEEALKEMAKEYATEEKLEEINNAIEEKNAKSICTERMSIKAELHDCYLTIYCVLSQSVHTSVRDLERHLVLNEIGIIKELCNEPAIDDLAVLLLMASESLLHALNSLKILFKIDVEAFCSEKYKALEELVNTMRANNQVNQAARNAAD